jgi:hypothetical protein
MYSYYIVALTIIPTTVLNEKVLFAIGHNVPVSISQGKGTQYNIRCPSFLFLAAEASLVPSDIVKLTKTCCVH